MTGRTHDLGAFTALFLMALNVVLPQMSVTTFVLALVANQMGAIAPDLDEPTAHLWRSHPLGGVVGKVVDRMLGGHRFLSHSLLGVFLFGVGFHYLLAFFQPSVRSMDVTLIWRSFMIGIVSHLLLDTLTKEGVPWFLPLPLKIGFPPLKALRITTGELVEKGLIFPGLLLLNFYLLWSHYETIRQFFHLNIH